MSVFTGSYLSVFLPSRVNTRPSSHFNENDPSAVLNMYNINPTLQMNMYTFGQSALSCK